MLAVNLCFRDSRTRMCTSPRLVRAMNSLYVYPDMDLANQLDEFEARFSDEPTRMLHFDTAKVYVDGILD